MPTRGSQGQLWVMQGAWVSCRACWTCAGRSVTPCTPASSKRRYGRAHKAHLQVLRPCVAVSLCFAAAAEPLDARRCCVTGMLDCISLCESVQVHWWQGSNPGTAGWTLAELVAPPLAFRACLCGCQPLWVTCIHFVASQTKHLMQAMQITNAHVLHLQQRPALNH